MTAEPEKEAGLTVAEVRRALAYIRKAWDEQLADNRKRPLYLCDPVCPPHTRLAHQSIGSFALNFIVAHHSRRLSKVGDAPGLDKESVEAKSETLA